MLRTNLCEANQNRLNVSQAEARKDTAISVHVAIPANHAQRVMGQMRSAVC